MEYIFVYGVFRDASMDLLKNAIYCGNAFVYGKMYQVNEFYPGYQRSSCGSSLCDHNCDMCRVYGDMYLIDESKLAPLDEFEGDEYTRKKIWTSLGEESWIYEYIYDVKPFKQIIGGDWLLR